MACLSGKVPYTTREAALEHQKALAYRNHLDGHPERSKGLNVYLCDCTAWHVGHLWDTTPLVYHYTTMATLDSIVQRGELRPRSKDVREPHPLLWFSWNPNWDHSVVKDDREEQVPSTGRWATEVTGGGLIRWGAPAWVAKLRWSDYLTLNKKPKVEREYLALRGNPTEWLCTDHPVPLTDCRTFDVYYRGQWTSGESVSDEAFEAYVYDREEVYLRAWIRLIDKIDAAKTDAATPDHLDLCLDDDAEVIICEDYVLANRLSRWRRQHRAEIEQYNVQQDILQRGMRQRRRRR